MQKIIIYYWKIAKNTESAQLWKSSNGFVCINLFQSGDSIQ